MERWYKDMDSSKRYESVKPSSNGNVCSFQMPDREPAFRWWVPRMLTNRDLLIAAVNSCVKKATYKYGLEVPRTVWWNLDSKSACSVKDNLALLPLSSVFQNKLPMVLGQRRTVDQVETNCESYLLFANCLLFFSVISDQQFLINMFIFMSSWYPQMHTWIWDSTGYHDVQDCWNIMITQHRSPGAK